MVGAKKSHERGGIIRMKWGGTKNQPTIPQKDWGGEKRDEFSFSGERKTKTQRS